MDKLDTIWMYTPFVIKFLVMMAAFMTLALTTA